MTQEKSEEVLAIREWVAATPPTTSGEVAWSNTVASALDEVERLQAEVERLQRIEAAAREVVEAGSSREALRLCADLADAVGVPDAR